MAWWSGPIRIVKSKKGKMVRLGRPNILPPKDWQGRRTKTSLNRVGWGGEKDAHEEKAKMEAEGGGE